MKKILIVLLILSCNAFAKPKTQTESVLLFNATSDKVTLQRNADQVRSIASITKLMTAMVTLDYDKDLSRKLMLSKAVPSKLPKQEYTRTQLLEAMLVNSDNAAAETLATDFPGGREAFIQTMNMYAHLWGLANTHFIDPSGLSPFNLSTAREVADLTHTATGYWFIQDVGRKKQVRLEVNKKKNRVINLAHTSGNILEFNNVLISKTGLTNAAGWCASVVLKRDREEYVIVVLGSKNKTARLHTIKEIMHTYNLDN